MPSVCFWAPSLPIRRKTGQEDRDSLGPVDCALASLQAWQAWQAWLRDLTVRRSYGKSCEKVTRKREARTGALWGFRHSELLASTPDTTHAKALFLSWPARPFPSSQPASLRCQAACQLGPLESPEPKRDWLRPPAATS